MSHQLGAIKRLQQRTIRILQRPSSVAICWLKKVLRTKKDSVPHPLNKPTTLCTTTLEPFEQTWVIDKFSFYFDEVFTGTVSLCSMFLSPSTHQHLRLFIQIGTRSILNPNEFVSLFLANELNDQCVDTKAVLFKLSIIDRNGVKRHSKASIAQFGRPQGVCGWENFIARDTLFDPANGLLCDDKLTIYCEANLLDNVDNDANDKCVDSDKAKLDTKFVEWKTALFESGKFTDVVLALEDGRELRAHKAILASASAVFEAMFDADWLENSSNRVAITGTSVQLFQQMLQYIYTDKLELIDQCDHQQLMILSDKYQIGSLKNVCEQSLCSKLSLDNATELFELANTYDAHKLKAAVLDLAKRHIENSVQTILNNPKQTIEVGKLLFALTGDEEKSI